MSEAIAEVEDEDFLLQVAAMEAEALSSKRRKITTTTTTTAANSPVTKAEEEEGAYIAVLKGSKSHKFQQQFSTIVNKPNAATVLANRNSEISTAGGGGGGGSCFKCGKLGHWARDCDVNSSYVTADSSVPEKACPCGLGSCIVRTAKTEKNSGRKFYKCPQENGGCGFFEWCDNSSGVDNIAIRSQSYSMKPSVPELLCPCGAGSCVTLTAKTGNNIGRQFYRCPASQRSCGFFKWCNDQTAEVGLSDSLNISKVHKNAPEASNKSQGVTTSSCFKCGMEGHWARDCKQTSFLPPVINSEGKNASSNTCFKCGKPGHWAKDCSSAQM